jgi:curved DNA-binding protein CbpA
MGRDTFYDILGVSPTATPEEVKARYRNLLLRIHPDVDGSPALFRQVQEAFEVLSDPVRRASYDRFIESPGGTPRTLLIPHDRSPGGWGSEPSSRAAYSGRPQPSYRAASTTSVLGRHPAGGVAMAGAILLVFGIALGQVGILLIVLGMAMLVIAGVAGLGGRGAKERRAYQRSGMAAVDTMTGRQFEVLLEHFFANKGYRVARIGGRGEFGADLLLNDAHGRMIVQARRWNGVVHHDTVQQAVAAMARYGAARALVVTSSDYSQDAVTVANSNGVTLWNRAVLAAELTTFRGTPLRPGVKRLSSEIRAGTRICLGVLAALFVAFVAVSTQARRRRS